MESKSLLLRVAKLAVLSGLAVGANAANFDPRSAGAGNSLASSNPLLALPSTFIDALAVAPSGDMGSGYSVIVGLAVMGAIVLRRQSSKSS